MVDVTLTKGNGEYKVISKGHATGSVEVCAAVSALLYTLVAYVDSLEGAHFRNVKLADGDAEVEIVGGKHAFDMFSCGINLLARDYSDFLSVNWAKSEEP